jgi:hypothetical protein
MSVARRGVCTLIFYWQQKSMTYKRRRMKVCYLNHKFAAYASEVARQGDASGGKLVNGVDGSGKMERQFNRKPFGGHMT